MKKIKITVNGKIEEFLENVTLLDLLSYYQITEDTEGVAVAVDENLVLKCHWKDFQLLDGNKVEIVWARQGG